MKSYIFVLGLLLTACNKVDKVKVVTIKEPQIVKPQLRFERIVIDWELESVTIPLEDFQKLGDSCEVSIGLTKNKVDYQGPSKY